MSEHPVSAMPEMKRGDKEEILPCPPSSDRPPASLPTSPIEFEPRIDYESTADCLSSDIPPKEGWLLPSFPTMSQLSSPYIPAGAGHGSGRERRVETRRPGDPDRETMSKGEVGGRALPARSSFRIRHQGLNRIDRPGEVAAALVTDQLL